MIHLARIHPARIHPARIDTARIDTARLSLTPLHESDADAMVTVLDDTRLHTFIGGAPASLTDLRRRYRLLAAGSGDPDQVWLNWIVRLDGVPTGTVQATLRSTARAPASGSDSAPGGDAWTATVAWVIGVRWQRQGIASEAACTLVEWLLARGVTEVTAHIHPAHVASARVAASAGLAITPDEVDGEQVWRRVLNPG